MEARMEKHLNALGALFIGYGVIGLIATVALAALFSLGIGFVGEPEIEFLIEGLGLFLVVLIAVTEIPAIFIGIGLLKRQNWARIAGLILAAINIIELPIGAALGIYAIWVLSKPETAMHKPA